MRFYILPKIYRRQGFSKPLISSALIFSMQMKRLEEENFLNKSEVNKITINEPEI